MYTNNKKKFMKPWKRTEPTGFETKVKRNCRPAVFVYRNVSD